MRQESLRRVCEEMEGVVCGPDARFLLGVEDFEEGDIHPNGSGHRKIAEALADALRGLYAASPGSSDAAAESSSAGVSHSAPAPAASSSSRLP